MRSRNKSLSNPVSTVWLMEAMAQQHAIFVRKKAHGTHPFLRITQAGSREAAQTIPSHKIDETELTYIRALDEGTFGVAYLARWKNKVVVVKEFKLSIMDRGECDEEREVMQILTDLKAPNMVNLFGYSQSSLHYSLVMPYMQNGSLANYMDNKENEPFSWRTTYRIIEDFVRAIEYLHRNDMVHGDVKDTNILLDQNMRAYLADFGVTRETDNKVWDDINIYWRAPEALFEPYIQSTEMYSVAVVMWQLVNWDTPFSRCHDEKKIAHYVGGGGRLKIDPDCPIPLAKWIRACWRHTPEKRMTATELLDNVESVTKKPELKKEKKNLLNEAPDFTPLRKSV